MAYKKNYKRKTYKKRTHKCDKSSMGAATTLAKNIGGMGLKILKSKLGLNTENKYWDGISALAGITNTIALWTEPTDGIAQGLTTSTRIGDSIRVTHFKFRGHIQIHGSNVTGERVRVIITYQPKSPATTVLAGSAVVQTTTNINSPYAQNLSGLNILYDETFELTPNIRPIVPLSFNYHPLNHHVRWTTADTTGTTSNVEEGALKIYAYCLSTSNFPSIASYSRLYYVDN